jgi:hypothetical protein
MNILWKFISNIYCDLIVSGFKISPPNFLFNNPKRILKCEYVETIFADKNFTEEEKILIMAGAKDLEKFCNGIIKFEIYFTLDSDNQDQLDSNCVMLRSEEVDPHIVSMDEKFKARILGLCSYMDNGTRRVHLIPARLRNTLQFRTTVIHELGHFIGLDHTEAPSIMHKSNFGNVLQPTHLDAVEMAKVYVQFGCTPEDFKYIKL